MIPADYTHCAGIECDRKDECDRYQSIFRRDDCPYMSMTSNLCNEFPAFIATKTDKD